MRIEVTAEDIRRGKRSAACSCPIALATKRATGFATVGVDGTKMAIIGVDPWIYLPAEAREFVRRFDGGEPVEPFAFDLPIPEAPPCA